MYYPYDNGFSMSSLGFKPGVYPRLVVPTMSPEGWYQSPGCDTLPM